MSKNVPIATRPTHAVLYKGRLIEVLQYIPRLSRDEGFSVKYRILLGHDVSGWKELGRIDVPGPFPSRELADDAAIQDGKAKIDDLDVQQA
jgi:hypothetical protein